MQSINDIKEDLELLIDDIDSRYEYILDLGKDLDISNDIISSENEVQGCLSKVWVKVNIINDKVYLDVNSDALTVKGILYIIKSYYDGVALNEAKNMNFSEKASEIKLESYLSTNRRNGLNSISEFIKNKIINNQGNQQ